MHGQEKKAWHLYILRCRDGSLYTGITTDVKRRINQHNAGKGAKYTRSRNPCVLVAKWTVVSRSHALQAEHRVKCLSRKEKLALIRNPNLISLVLDKPEHVIPVDVPDCDLFSDLNVSTGSNLDDGDVIKHLPMSVVV